MLIPFVPLHNHEVGRTSLKNGRIRKSNMETPFKENLDGKNFFVDNFCDSVNDFSKPHPHSSKGGTYFPTLEMLDLTM